jgi:hypothetical protein
MINECRTIDDMGMARETEVIAEHLLQSHVVSHISLNELISHRTQTATHGRPLLIENFNKIGGGDKNLI